MSPSRAVASRLACPRCGLVVGSARRHGEVEHCPRCIARSAGALSIRLEHCEAPARGQPRPRELIVRLARRIRGRAL